MADIDPKNPFGSNAVALRQASALQSTGGVETASTALAAQAKAMVESRYYMALARPRNWDQVRQDILKECSRPSFAHNKSTLYKKPIGKGIEGLGIRFTEMALRCMTNVLIETNMIFEDTLKEVHRVSVTDLESNVTYPLDIVVSKTVERSKPMDDGSYISVRKNSYGNMTYTVPATDDDLLNKRGALISKAQRTLTLRIVPGDLQDEAEQIIRKIREDKAAKDPDAERRNIVDAFGELNIKAKDLEEYLGHDVGTCTPAELVDMRGLYGALRDGEATWKTVMDNKREIEEQSAGDPSKHAAKPKTGAGALKEAIKPSSGSGPASETKNPEGQEEITVLDAIAKLPSFKDIDKLDEYMDALPMAVKQDDRVANKFAECRGLLKDANGKAKK